MKKRLKTNGVIIVAACLLIALFPAIFFRNEDAASFYAAGRILEVFGIALILLGQMLRVSGRGYKAEHSQKGETLIQGGPYSLVRNPMYLGILLIGLGVVSILFKWWVAGIFLGVFIIRYILLIFKEEKKLRALFPKEYQDYCKSVPRIFPSIAMIVAADISEYLPLKFSWLKKEIGTMSAVLFITLFLESWEDIKRRGTEIYLKEAAALMIVIVLFIGLIIYLSRRTASSKKDVSN